MIYIDKKSKIPFYKQIYQQIQKDILEKRILPGTILKGSRLVAKDIGTGRNTVEHAYTLLADEGYIVAKKGVGYIVQDTYEEILETPAISCTNEEEKKNVQI